MFKWQRIFNESKKLFKRKGGKMKKTNKILYFLMLCLVIVSLFLFASETKVSFADVPVSDEFYGLDYDTYDTLLTMKKVITDDKLSTTFARDFFENGYKNYSPSTEDGQKMVSDLNNGKLYLVAGDEAVYPSLAKKTPISSLACLEKLAFSNISELYLDNNDLLEITSAQLASFTNLKVLSANFNKLSKVALPDLILKNLDSISLMGNKLSAIDLSALKNGANVNLFDNYFGKKADIKLPQNLSSLDLSFNNLVDETADSFNVGCEPILLVQGLKQDLKALSEITTFNNNLSVVSGLSTIVKYREASGDSSSFSGEIIRSDATKNSDSILMPMGKLSIDFVYSNGVGLKDYHISKLGSYTINIAPTNPTVSCLIAGVVSTNYVSDKDIEFSQTIEFDPSLPNYKDVVKNTTLGIFRAGSGTFSDKISITNVGKFSLQFYSEFDGLKSSGVTILGEKTGRNFVALGIVIVVIIVTLTICGVFLARWFSNGAVVAPLSDKEIYQANKRASRRGKERLKYSYEKETTDETTVYRKNKNHYLEQDYVDLEEGSENQNIDNDKISDDTNTKYTDSDYEKDELNDGEDFYDE